MNAFRITGPTCGMTDERPPMRFLVFTTLYPNAAAPSHGVFVENRLRAFLKAHDAEVKVIAPVPWFPFAHDMFGRYAKWARVPAREMRHGIEILHPRYAIPPKIGMKYAPAALARCFRKTIRKLIEEGWDFDFIDAHYFYPDGVAAAMIAHELEKPLVITARGTDVNLIPAYNGPRQKIVAAAIRADAIITVADALKDELIRLGAPARKIATLRNGVDLETFRPGDRERIRKGLGLSGPVIASVGHLIDRKGHDVVIAALKDIPNATLLIAGEGEKRKALEALARREGVSPRVRFLGAVPHEQLCDVYNAADVLVLASSREGWPNVLLEAMACGTPCAASNVWGAKEVIRDPSAGKLVEERTPEAFAAAINNLLAAPPDRAATRAYAEAHSWDDTVKGTTAIFSDLSEKAAAARAVTAAPVTTLRSSDPPKLIVTVDTEERFDWSNFDSIDYACCDPADIDCFQKLCADAGVAPLYFLTYPLLKDAASSSCFRKLVDSAAADCGLHLHQWATPPDADLPGEYYSFQKNLPSALHLQKLKALAEAFEAVFGAPAVAHRAGRYGVSRKDYALLSDIGVKFDFSPSVSFDFSDKGGPDFSGYGNAPFVAAGAAGNIFVTPVCGAQAIRFTSRFISRAGCASGFALPKRGAFHSFLRPMRLSPEGASLDDLKALTRRLIDDQTPVLTFTLHSTSLTIGANDYAKTGSDVARMLDISRDYFNWFRSIGGDIISFRALAELYERDPAFRI